MSLVWAKHNCDIKRALESGPESCFITLSEMPGMLEEAKIALGLPIVIDHAAVLAAISQRWMGSLWFLPKSGSRLAALRDVLGPSHERHYQLSAKEMVDILLGPYAPTESSAALTIWAKTHQCYTHLPLAMDLVVFPAKGKVLDIGAFLGFSQSGSMICLMPSGDVTHKHGKHTIVKFGSGRKKENAPKEEASGAQGH